MKVEVLIPPWLDGNSSASRLARASFAGLTAFGLDVSMKVWPSGGAQWLVLWGLGHPSAQTLLRERGRSTVIGWDLGYWKRATHYRVSINDAHPARYVMAKERSPVRFQRDGIVLRDDGDPAGPVFLIGIGYKSAATYGEHPGEWEDRALAKLRAAWPEMPILFRPKPKGGGHHPAGVEVVPATVPIEVLLRRAAAVYCRHSNVAVDAIIAGVPAIAEDGAAAAVCEHEPNPGRLPTKLTNLARMVFLANLAWFQWSEAEIERPETWAVIDDIIRSVN